MSFQPPRFDAQPPVRESLAALPKSATCLGLYFNDILDAVARERPDADLFAAANLQKKRHFPFFSYSYAELIQLMTAAGKLIHPRVPQGEALRRLGHTAYDRLFSTRVGQVLFGVLGGDTRKILLAGPRGYSLSCNFGETTAEEIDAHRIIYHFRKMPILVETYQVGVIEGALRHMKISGTVRVDIIDIANADLEITWT